MMGITVSQNMGTVDRMVRGLLGAAMLLHGLVTENKTVFNRIELVVGGAFLTYGITGFDPLLTVWGVTTKPGDTDNLVNRIIKKQMPGQGMKPMLMQQPVPQKRFLENGIRRNLSELLAIH